MTYTRAFALDDIAIKSGGDGRTVEAYAAVFDAPAQVVDQDGMYEEVCDKGMFNRALGLARRSNGGWSLPVMYNHGMTLYGTPSPQHSVPIGVPEDIRAEPKGLYTRTRFHKTPAADEILEAIREGSIRAYSFAGDFKKSDPAVPRGGFRADVAGRLQRVRRLASSLREYGPTPFPVYAGAEVVGVRAEQAAMLLNRLPPEEFARLLEMARNGTHLPAVEALDDQPDEVRSRMEPASAEDQPPAEESAEHSERRQLTPREAICARRATWIIRQRNEEHAST
jgi:HK97 family phage prohead protease